MLYQLSYQGIGRSIAQGLFRGKGFLCIFRQKLVRHRNDLVLANSPPYCRKPNRETSKREINQFSGKANSRAIQHFFARRTGFAFHSWRNFQLPAYSRNLDDAVGPDDSFH